MQRRHVYGPVRSRRFGRSLGVDLVPHKVCSYDCTYCQLGLTTELATAPRTFASPEAILADLDAAFAEGVDADVITLAGSGEPTLYRDLAAVVEGIRARTSTPLVLLTNGSLLWDPAVRAAVRGVHLLEPSLDAPDEATWRRLNRPPPDHSFARMVEGLRAAAAEHPGRVRMEVMLLRGENDSEEQLLAFAALLATLRLEGVDINSPVRPVPEEGVLPCDAATLERARTLFGPRAAIIAAGWSPAPSRDPEPSRPSADAVLDSLGRRPQTLSDLASGLGVAPVELSKLLAAHLDAGEVVTEVRGGELWYRRR